MAPSLLLILPRNYSVSLVNKEKLFFELTLDNERVKRGKKKLSPGAQEDLVGQLENKQEFNDVHTIMLFIIALHTSDC